MMTTKHYVSHSGRQVKYTEKMANFMNKKQKEPSLEDIVMEKELELEVLKTKMEISKMEQEIQNVTLQLSRDKHLNKRSVDINVGETAKLNYMSTPRADDSMKFQPPKWSNEMSLNACSESNVKMNQPLLASSKQVHYGPVTSVNTQRVLVDEPVPPPINMHEPQAEPACSGYQPPPRSNTSQAENVSLSESFKQLVDLLSDKQDKLPKMEPEVFSGDIMKYPLWIKSFEALIERRTESSQDRLYYMSKYTCGEAKTVISGYLTLDTPDTYSKAKQALNLRYGDKFRLSECYKRRLKEWPVIKPNDGPALQKFADFLQHCNAGMTSTSFLRILDNPDENREMIKKLPRGIADRWNRVVDSYLYESHRNHGDSAYPPFAAFSDFLQKEARIACGPGAVHSSTPDSVAERRRNQATALTSAASATVGKPKNTSLSESSSVSSVHGPKCFICGKEHYLSKCEQFKTMTLKDRQVFCGKKGLCFGCFRHGHLRANCPRTGRPLLFLGLPPKSSTDNPSSRSDLQQVYRAKTTVEAACQKVEVKSVEDKEPVVHSMIVPVTIHHKNNPSHKIESYALLDNQSNSCFMKETLADELHAPSEDINLKLTTMLETQSVDSSVIKDLVICGKGETAEIVLPPTYTRDCIPADKSLIPRSETVMKWQHLKEVAVKLQPYHENVDIGLLIGFNCTAALLPQNIVADRPEKPYGMKTALGWGVVGVMSDDVEADPPNFVFRTHAEEISPIQIKEMYETEFNETKSGPSYSVEDLKFLEIMEKEITHRDDSHYELPLPFRSSNVSLPNNKLLAWKRFQGLKKKLQRSDTYLQDYERNMKDVIDKGYAEKVPEDELERKDVWYVPHHGVYHPNKPKLRVVFDCSSKYMGVSLNDELLPGPDQMNNLTGVLCRFRKEQVALACDIEGMFHQVGVKKEHRDYFRFFWTDDKGKEQEYRMNVHLFGAASSPGCAIYALKAAADDHQDHEENASNFIKRGFYVDDGLTSTSTVEDATELVSNTIKLCEGGGFKLHKFVSTHREVLEKIPTEYKAKDIQILDLSSNQLPISRTLGIEWHPEEDVFTFSVKVKDGDVTRRSILSAVSSIFDPLGLVSPFILIGRKILQEICRDGCGWDDPVPKQLEADWLKWKTEIPLLNQVHVKRCYKSADASTVRKIELHHFGDASQKAYGQCSYLKIVDQTGQVSTSLVMAKSRVAPAKAVTIPRLELMAAVLSVKVAEFLDSELDYKEVEHVFWTDSKIVLGYINNEVRKFHVFVANRVQQIHSFSRPNQWHYIESAKNPADMASRGVNIEEMISSELWWNGPTSVMSSTFSTAIQDNELCENDPEVKRSVTMATTVSIAEKNQHEGIIDRLQKFSSWMSAKRAVAACLRFKNLMCSGAIKRKTRGKYQPVTVQELQNAEVQILKQLQTDAFAEEKKQLKRDKGGLRKDSSLLKLDPFVDENGLLRVGGRVRRASLNYSATHPVIIPKNSHIARLIICHYHAKSGHAGSNYTLGQIRAAGYWIIRGLTSIKSFIQKCVMCRRIRGKTQVQKMADLPQDRLQPCPAFTYCAVDLFGPFLVKEGRSTRKRWGAMFVCMASRAVHIEVVATLSTDSFINAYRRFVGRRGPIRQLRCDRGTNFIGAKNELNEEAVKQKLRTDGCQFDAFQFETNFPHASHMGGVWERMIRTARSALSSILVSQPCTLDDELLNTFLVEAEMIVNNRPLTYVDNSDPLQSEPLTPAQLLTLKEQVVLPPPGNFMKADLFCRKRWRKVQYLSNQFWQRWIREFLPTLQERRKWHNVEDNLRVNDIVMIADENTGRSQWPRGKITATFPSEDGLVRKVQVQTTETVLERPVHKLVLLYREEN